jgi:hypothetical protein
MVSPKTERNQTVDLWALDEVHFQQRGSRCRMWVPPEIKDPVIYHHRALLHLPWREQQAPAFRLDFLPPYSPELNPIERVRKLTKAAMPPQSLFRVPGICRRSRRNPLCRMGVAQRNLTSIMRNYLRRCV